MKLPTLTAISLATAVLAAAPALAATNGTGNADNGATNQTSAADAQANSTTTGKATPPETAATSSSAAAAPGTAGAAVPGANMPATVAAPQGAANTGPNGANSQMAADTTATTPGVEAATTTGTPGMQLTNNPIGTANVVPVENGNQNANAGKERAPHQRNPVLADDGLPRAGKVIGSAVYNDSDKKVGSVSDILMGERGQPDMVALNLSEGNKRVLLPFRKFVFGNTTISGDNRVLLPKQTPMSLAQMAPSHFDANNSGNNNGHSIAGAGAMPAAGTAGLAPVAPVHPPAAPANATGNAPAVPADTTAAGPGADLATQPIGTATVMVNNNANKANNNANSQALPHQRNPVLADDGLPRASKVIGSTVYDPHGQNVGSVDDVLMGLNGEPDQAVIDVNNGHKKVLVPFKDLVFGNASVNSDNRVILPNQTQVSLEKLPTFSYNRNNA